MIILLSIICKVLDNFTAWVGSMRMNGRTPRFWWDSEGGRRTFDPKFNFIHGLFVDMKIKIYMLEKDVAIAFFNL